MNKKKTAQGNFQHKKEKKIAIVFEKSGIFSTE